MEEDNTENRVKLKDTANNKDNYLGSDNHGNKWYGKINSDGTQTWVEVRNGKIINGGVNNQPKPYNSETGLSSPTKP